MTNTQNASTEEALSASAPTDLEAISHEQALLDFDVANARVVDLTRRLIEASDELLTLRHEVELLRAEVAAARGSRAYIIARKTHTLIRLLRP